MRERICKREIPEIWKLEPGTPEKMIGIGEGNQGFLTQLSMPLKSSQMISLFVFGILASPAYSRHEERSYDFNENIKHFAANGNNRMSLIGFFAFAIPSLPADIARSGKERPRIS
jgi:hypothetical protein